MPRPKTGITKVRINLFVLPDTARLLGELAPSENKRGEFIDELVKRAAQDRGIVEPPAGLDLAALQVQLQAAQQQVQQVQAHYESLLSRVTTALERQQP